MTHINYHGSKWAGQAPDPLPVLFEMLAREPLDPSFEVYGNFVNASAEIAALCGPGVVRFWGNFWITSHVFSIDTDEPEVIAQLTRAIRANQDTQAYRDAKTEWTAHQQREVDARAARDRHYHHRVAVRRNRR